MSSCAYIMKNYNRLFPSSLIYFPTSHLSTANQLTVLFLVFRYYFARMLGKSYRKTCIEYVYLIRRYNIFSKKKPFVARKISSGYDNNKF